MNAPFQRRRTYWILSLIHIYCAGLEVAASPKITSITPADAEHRGYSSAAITHELTSGETVSYTHLDVYKRQTLHNPCY